MGNSCCMPTQLYTKLVSLGLPAPEFGIIMAGLDGVGKALMRLLGRHISAYLGCNHETIFRQDSRLCIWDLCGVSQYRKYYGQFYENAKGLIFVVDATLPGQDRFEESKAMLTEVSADPRLRTVPILLFATKQDQPGALLVSDIYSHFNQVLETRTYHIQPCSGVTGEGLWAGIDWLLDAMKQQHREYAASIST